MSKILAIIMIMRVIMMSVSSTHSTRTTLDENASDGSCVCGQLSSIGGSMKMLPPPLHWNGRASNNCQLSSHSQAHDGRCLPAGLCFAPTRRPAIH